MPHAADTRGSGGTRLSCSHISSPGSQNIASSTALSPRGSIPQGVTAQPLGCLPRPTLMGTCLGTSLRFATGPDDSLPGCRLTEIVRFCSRIEINTQQPWTFLSRCKTFHPTRPPLTHTFTHSGWLWETVRTCTHTHVVSQTPHHL